jgi:hypothetical protein
MLSLIGHTQRQPNVLAEHQFFVLNAVLIKPERSLNFLRPLVHAGAGRIEHRVPIHGPGGSRNPDQTGRRFSLSSVTAEGVETREQFETLRTLGMNFAQGYLLGRPVPIDELEGQSLGYRSKDAA